MSRGAGYWRDSGGRWSLSTMLLLTIAFVLSACTGAVGTKDDKTGTVSYAACTGTTATPTPASPAAVGTTVSFAVTGSCDTDGDTPEYSLSVIPPGGTDYTVVQNWQDSNTLTWTPTIAGAYSVRAAIRAKGTTSASNVDSSYTVAGCSAVTGAVDVTTATVGTTVHLSATSTCDGGYTPEYQFWYAPPNSTNWQALNSFGSANTFNWSTAGLATGSYRVRAYVRRAGSTATESEGAVSPTSLGVTLTYVAPCTAVSAGLAPPSNTAGAGTAVTITATPTCPNGVIPEFAYWTSVGDPLSQSSTWTLLKTWSRDTTATFTGTVAGTNGVSVIVRATGNTDDYGDAYDTEAYVYTGTTVTSCTGGQTLCGTVCVDTATDALHCGDCATNCTLTGQACSGGACFTPNCGSLTGSPSVSTATPGTQITLTGNATCDVGTAEYQFSVKAPGQSWAVLRSFLPSNVYNWNTTGLAAGTYNMKIETRHSGSTGAAESEATFDVTLALAGCSGVTMSASPTTANAGTSVTFSATGTCTGGSPEYEFLYQNPSTGAWSSVQAYSSSASYAWNTTGLTAGTYRFAVYARHSGSTAEWETFTTMYYALGAQPGSCTGVSMSASPTTAGVGTSVTFSATGTCTGGSPEYQFLAQNPSTGSWTTVQAYSTSASYVWNTTGLTVGTYRFAVYARGAGSTADWETFTTMYYELSTQPGNCTGVTMSASPTTAGVGTSVTFSATGTCTGGSPEYQFLAQDPSTGSWTTVQAYSTSASYVWNTTGLTVGTYRFAVYARGSGSTAEWQTFTTMYYELSTQPGNCTGVTMSASPATGGVGTSVTFSATGTCTGGSPEYQFLYQNPSTGSWSTVQAYSTASSYAWNTNALTEGTYRFAVYARGSGSTAEWQTFTTMYYTLSASPPGVCTGVTLSASPAQASAGTTVTFSASGTCTGGAPQYQFLYQNPSNGSWSTVQAYSTATGYGWDTTGLSGTHRFAVYARGSGSTADWEAFTTLYYPLSN